MSAYRSYSTRQTPQSQPVPGKTQVENDAGGYVFPLDDWKRLDRFLILGSDAPTYYVGAQELTRRNADCVLRCVQADGARTVKTITDVSVVGRAPKNDPALFALAMCIKLGDEDTRKAAAEALPKVARIGTHLFHFVQYMEQFGGWSKLTRRAVADWYNAKPIGKVEYQAVKYQQRDGWSNRDLLRLSHPRPTTKAHDELYRWCVKGWEDIGSEPSPTLPMVWAFERAKRTGSKSEVIKLITDHGLTREMIPTQWLNDVAVWSALLSKMPLTAMIRNLGKMTSIELLKPLSRISSFVCDKIRDGEYLRKSRVHPLSVLVALRIYEQGHGVRGKLSWNPVSKVVDALDDAFYLSFGNVEPTGKNILLGLDVSGSMGVSLNGLPLTAREASAAMALVTARVEPNHEITAFSDRMVPVSISPRQRLDDVIRATARIPFGRTNCALPMLYALSAGLDVDAFLVYTDSETWYGDIHPFQALQGYRQTRGIPAKSVVVAMTSTGFSLADPGDAGSLDVVGFDTATPNVISNFIQG